MKREYKEGFSLVEMLIAMAITGILMVALISLMGYSTRNMRQTQERVSLQEQAKDAFNHIAAYAMEATTFEWDDANKALKVTRTEVDDTADKAKTATEVDYYYWQVDDKIYFASEQALADEAGETDLEAFTPSYAAAANHLMAENVDSFSCEKKEPDTSENKARLFVTLGMASDMATYESTRDVCMRNQ